MATENNLDQEQQLTIDDIDTPVDEKLLMGGDDADDGAGEEGEGADGEGQDGDDTDLDDLKKIAGDDNGEGDGRASAGGEDGAADGEGDDKDGSIPKERFNQVYREMKALKEELKALKGGDTDGQGSGDGQGEQHKEPDLKSMRDREAAIEEEIEQALLDGDTDKTKALRAERRQLVEQIDAEIERRAEIRAERRIETKREVAEFKKVAAQLTDENPILHPETGNPKAIAFVVNARDGYIEQGMSMVDALKQAVADMAELIGTGKQSGNNGDGDNGEKKPDDRKVTAINRGAKDSNRVPPAGGGVGNRAMDMPDGGDIPQEKWDNLPQAERDRILAGG